MKTIKGELEKRFSEITKKRKELADIFENGEKGLLREEYSLLKGPLLELIDGCSYPVHIGEYGPLFNGDGLCYEFLQKYNFEPKNIETIIEMLTKKGKLLKVRHYGYDYTYEASFVITNYFTERSLAAWFKTAIKPREKFDSPESYLADYKLVKSNNKEIPLIELYESFNKLPGWMNEAIE